ncbi:MAG: sigma-E processing peptidase SpoIIGA [Clostridia bacterium]|nr:sigma-E processing peptidase SpoIIGA [Clostridia bacterium]
MATFICAFLGAFFALLMPLLKVPTLFLILIKVVSGLIIVLLSTKFKNFSTFLTTYIVFLSYTFLLGGSVLGILELFNINKSELVVATIFIPCYALIKLSKKVITLFNKKGEVLKNIVDCNLFNGDKKVLAKAFYDTGNNLYDKVGNPVLIIDKKLALKLIDITSLKNLEWIETTTVLGKSKIPTFTVDKVEINLKEKISLSKVRLGISNTLSCVEYDVILHSKILEETKCLKDLS